MDLTCIKHIHFVGIKGVAMTALAQVAYERGIAVSGSDISDDFPTTYLLEKNKINVFNGFLAKDIPVGTDLIIYTGAHGGSTNPQVVYAQKYGIPVLPHGKALELFTQDKKTIAVSGSHGKTTTSALIATVLATQGYDPSFAIGCGDIFGIGKTGQSGEGDYFVAEADEYMTDPQIDSTPRFLWLTPFVSIITNIEYDHPDAFSNLKAVENAFFQFVQKTNNDGFLVINSDSSTTNHLIKKIQGKKVITYGISKNADFSAEKIHFTPGKTQFDVIFKKKKLKTFTLLVPGLHNVYNAVSAIGALFTLGIPVEKIQKGVEQFKGTKRRFEKIGEKNDVMYFDDYAHHPTEISETLKACRSWYPHNRVIVIFQPHTYSRTLSLLDEFAHAFSEADVVIITDIYSSAREVAVFGVSGQTVVNEVTRNHPKVTYAPGRDDVLDYLKTVIKSGDIVITMGAGDIYKWIEKEWYG